MTAVARSCAVSLTSSSSSSSSPHAACTRTRRLLLLCRTAVIYALSPLLFAALVLAITTAYYYVRIRFHDYADDVGDAHDGGNSAAVMRRAAVMSNSGTASVAADDDDAVLGEAQATTLAAYTGTYTVLRPGMMLPHETLRNPSLTAHDVRRRRHCGSSNNSSSSAAASNCGDDDKSDDDGAHRPATSETMATRRYVLTGLARRHRYMLRVCFLGSPSVSYELRLMHVTRRAVLRALRRGGDKAASALVATDNNNNNNNNDDDDNDDAASLYRLQDTEVRMFAVHHVYPHLFANDGVVLVNDDDDDDEELTRHNYTGTDSAKVAAAAANASRTRRRRPEAYVAVVEVVPHALALTTQPHRFAYVSYTIHLDALVANWLPAVTVPYVVCISVILVVTMQLLLPRNCARALLRSRLTPATATAALVDTDGDAASTPSSTPHSATTVCHTANNSDDAASVRSSCRHRRQ